MRKCVRKNSARILQLLAVLLAAVVMTGTASPAFAFFVSSGGADEEPIMVSLGDSYSSGEGVEPFYCSGRADKYTQPDWLAHRSKLSWPGKLQLTDSAGNRLVMAKNKAYYSSKTKSYDSYSKNNWYFVASSGAVTGSLRGTQNKSFDRDPANESPVQHSTVTLDNQLKVFESIEPGTTDYVTMTMGGNDAHFADVFIYAAFNCSFINVNGMEDYLGKIWDEFFNGANSIQNRLIRAYTDIHNAAGDQADIIIAGYPKILPQKGFLIFSEEESKVIDTAITQLNLEMKAIVESLQSETFKIHFVSVEEAFEGHEIYTGLTKEYINGIKIIRTEDLSESQIISSYSLHPNKKGVKAYAACVQACIDDIEAQKQANAVVPSSLESGEEESEPFEQTALPSPENPTVDFYCEEGVLRAAAGERVSIPVTVAGDVPLKRCTLHFEYDSEALQMDCVSSGDLCEETLSDTIGTVENAFDVHWNSTDSAVTEGTLFYLNATVLSNTPTYIALCADEEKTLDKRGRTPALHCEDILINPAGVCTLRADLSEMEALQGAQVFMSENSLCRLTDDAPAFVPEELVLAIVAAGTQAEICFSKPGCTTLHVVIENICADAAIDLTSALQEAAAQQPLFTAGDFNGDGCVSEPDILQLMAAESFATYATAEDCSADLNADGMISLEDVAILLLSENFGATDITLTCAQEIVPAD